MGLTIGDKVPNFELPDQNGDIFKISDYLGRQFLLIYFYPKDESPGCTAEACTFRDNMDKFDDLNCKVIGISKDKPDKHKSFASNHRLPYTLLSDHKNKVRAIFGVKSVIPGILPGRKTYLINLEGKVSKIFEYQFQPKKHVLEALLALEPKPE